MKKLITLCLLLMTLVSCNKSVSDKSITEKLTLEELSESIEADSSFADIYEKTKLQIELLPDTEKAKYHTITYKQLTDFYSFTNDSTYWKPLYEQWNKDYQRKSNRYTTIGDSIINYWKKEIIDSTVNSFFVPLEIKNYLNTDFIEYPNLSKSYKIRIIKTVDSTYVEDYEYKFNKASEILKARDPLVYEFLTFKH